jgi:hypothetical protein
VLVGFQLCEAYDMIVNRFHSSSPIHINLLDTQSVECGLPWNLSNTEPPHLAPHGRGFPPLVGEDGTSLHHPSISFRL